ncbi:MAG: CHAT domain-containing protein, partial [Pseudanabaenaceae cyanobacterium]
MKGWPLAIIVLGWSGAAVAEVVGPVLPNSGLVPDGSTPTQVLPNGDIVPGDRRGLRGSNLFHSFQRFAVPESGVRFTTGASGIDGRQVTNLIVRVTGDAPSLIGGPIRSAADFPRASLYLLNPNGLVFTAAARLDIGGSFVGATATALGFADDRRLVVDVRDNTFPSALPETLEFATANPAPLIHQGELRVRPGENIALVGGTLIATGTLTAPSGAVDVATVPGDTTVTLRSPLALTTLEINPGTAAPPWPGTPTPLLSLARLLTGPSTVPEAARVAIDEEGRLQLVPEGSSSPTIFVTPDRRLDIRGSQTVQRGDLALGAIGAGEIQALAHRNLLLFQVNLQASRALVLSADRQILLRDNLAQPSAIVAGGNLVLRGHQGIDLLALNHPDTPIRSGGLLSLQSDGPLLVDAYLQAIGGLTARPLTQPTLDFRSALNFQLDGGGSLRFGPPPAPEVQLRNLERYRTLIAVGGDTVDRTKTPPADNETDGQRTKASQPGLADAIAASPMNAKESTYGDRNIFSNVTDLLLQEGRILEAQQTLDWAILREIETYLGSPSRSLRPDQQNLYNRFAALEARLQSNPRPSERKTLEREWQELLNQIREVSAANLARLQAELRQQERPTAVLYPLMRDRQLELILIPPMGPPRRRTVAVDRATLEREIGAFRRALETVYDPALDPRQAGHQLYRRLIAPLEPDLAEWGIERLRYAPDRQLRYVPLAALHDGDRWLMERLTVVNITAASLEQAPRPPRPLRLLAGAVTRPSRVDRFFLAALPYVQQEIENLLTLFPNRSTPLWDGELQPATLLAQAPGYTTVHLATHALFQPGRPEDSFILFGNNRHQTLADVRTWQLPIDLLVLSACETAGSGLTGQGEEILGFGYL